ncbi:MAG: response regulator, partial [Dehalococcoidales bacterium]
MKVLIVEDDNKIITALTYCFQLVWPTIEIVATRWGEEGINLAESITPDVIILDLGLPDIDGLEVLKRLRLFSRIPVLVLTVNNDEASIVQALESGASDYVFKPFRQMELIARVKRLI